MSFFFFKVGLTLAGMKGSGGGGGGEGRRALLTWVVNDMTHRFREVIDGKVNESCVLLVFT